MEDRIVNERETSITEIYWAKLNGYDILEGPQYFPGKLIPIVRVIGDEVNIKGKRYWRSAFRDSKDPQRMYNYWLTTATELVALAPRAPFLLTPEEIAGHEHMWKNANVKNYPYLLYNLSLIHI